MSPSDENLEPSPDLGSELEATNSDSPHVDSNAEIESRTNTWFQSIWKSREHKPAENPDPEPHGPTIRERFTGFFHRRSSQESPDTVEPADELPDHADVVQDRSKLAHAFAAAVNGVSGEQDRREIVDWFVSAYDVLATEPQTAQKVAKLYRLIDSRRVGKLVANMARTASKNYAGSNLPLSIKLALPVTTLGACMFGAQGAGIAAFGGGIGLPVVLVLFLGSAGVASIIEALIRDKRNIEPTTRLLLSLIQLETTRRINKELAAELKADLEVPRRCDISGDDLQVLNQLRSMDPFDFERHVMSFFEVGGFPAGVTRKSKDKGFDGWFDHPQGLVIVQCKRNSESNAVGRPDLQQFKGVIEEQGAFHGYFVTTSTFSKDAEESAKLSEKVSLIGFEMLLAWHKQGKADLSGLSNGNLER